MNPLLALCMIVKDEETVLDRCLESVKNVVEEIVIVDTGSTDRTKEIALKYADRVYDFQWNDSFAEARNFAQSKARADWILVLDADEYVDEQNLRNVTEQLRENGASVDAYEATIYNFSGFQAESVFQHRSLRLYRNDENIRFDRAIHEQLVRLDGELRIGESGLIIYHTGYMPQTVITKDKHQRNMGLLSKERKISGDNPFDDFNLGNEYMGKRQFGKALEAYLRAYKNKKDFNYYWVSYCVVQIIKCLTELQRYTDALNVARDAEQIYLDAPDFKCLKANIYIKQYRLDEAEQVLVEFVADKDKFPRVISNVDFVDYWPYEQLGVVYELKEDYPRAVENYTKAFNINPSVQGVAVRLINLLSKYSSPDDFHHFVSKNQQVADKIGYTRLVGMLLSLGRPEHAERFLDHMRENELVVKGFEMKAQMCRGDFTPLTKFIMEEKGKIDQLVTMSENGCFDLLDLIIYGVLENQWDFMKLLAVRLTECKHRVFVEQVIAYFSGGTPNHFCEFDEYLLLLERSLVLGQHNFFEAALPKGDDVDPRILLSGGHVLFRYGEVDRACEIYERVPLDHYDDEAFVNLVSMFRRNNDPETALRYALIGLQFGHSDFRLFRDAVQFLNLLGFQTDIVPIVDLARQYYPDSRWLDHILEELVLIRSNN